MNKLYRLIGIVGVVLLLSSCSTIEETDSGKLKIAVSVLPQEAIVEAIAGDLVEVMTVIPPGASPANYQPTPKQIQEFGDAQVYFTIGVPTESANIFPNMVGDREDLQMVYLEDIVALDYAPRYFAEDEHEAHDEHEDEDHEEDSDTHEVGAHDADEEDHVDHEHADVDHDEHDDHTDHDHSGMDPHIWMSPKRMMVMAEETYSVLADLDADNATTYQENLQVFLDDLAALDESLMKTFDSLDNNKFIIMHPSMGYFAEDYGLEMVALEKDGKESTASHLQEVIEYALDHEIKVVFYQAEFDSSQAKTLAEEIDGEVMELETLSKDYINNMKAIEKIFVNTLK